MDSNLLQAVMHGNLDDIRQLKPNLADLIEQVTIYNQDTCIHVAARFNQWQVVEAFLDVDPEFVYLTNRKGDTPMHLAVREGSWETAEGFVTFSKDVKNRELETQQKLLRMKNEDGDTCLHIAIRNSNYNMVETLISADPELAGLENNAGESPLFLAVDRKLLRIARRLLQLNDPSFKGRDGMNALHAAIIRYKTAPHPVTAIFSTICRKHKNQEDIDRAFIKLLIEKDGSSLAELDDYGWSPLHYAAQIGETSVVGLLLQSNSSIAYSKTTEGMTALHIAATMGQVAVLQIFTTSCPELWEVEDNKGRTPLHNVAEMGNLSVVNHIFQNSVFGRIANRQDNDGNTALHLAVIFHRFKIVHLLAMDERVDNTIVNKHGCAVLDIVRSDNDLRFGKVFQRFLEGGGGALPSLKHAVPWVGRTKAVFKRADEPVDKDMDEFMKTNLLVTTLVATVSFAAGVTVPGGIRTEGAKKGTAILSRNSIFAFFVILNSLAFFCSTLSICVHYVIRWKGKSGRKIARFKSYAVELTKVAILSMAASFFTGITVVLSDAPWLAEVLQVVMMLEAMLIVAIMVYI